MESVGFKEWALICEALGRGEQSIILRKGGIAEGRRGFGFQHREFFLFPTFFHEQAGKLRATAGEMPRERAGEIEIKFFARLEFSSFVREWDEVIALQPFHLRQPEVVRDRFEYEDARGIHLGFVRVFRLEPRWIIPDEPRYGGCRSWVKLPEQPCQVQLRAVLSDDEHDARRRALAAYDASDSTKNSGSSFAAAGSSSRS